MTDSREVSGTDLRYLLTAYLFDHGPSTIDELVDALTYHGFHTVGRPSKAVSDALRWEVGQGSGDPIAARSLPSRIDGRGRPSTGSDMRVLALHDRVAELSRRAEQSQHEPGEPAA